MPRKTTGILFVATSLLMIACFALLGAKLGYPEILRLGAGTVLAKYREAGSLGPALYYGLLFSAVLLIYEAVLLCRVLGGDSRDPLPELGKYSGMLAGLFFIFGFMRWVFLMPLLARAHGGGEGAVPPEQVEIIFRAFDTYLGFSLGEHMGFMFLSLMLAFFGAAMIRSGRLPAWLGWAGILVGLGVLYGVTEAFGLPLSFAVSRTASKLSLVWMMLVGLFLLFGKTQDREE